MKLIDKHGIEWCKKKYEESYKVYFNLETKQKPKDAISLFVKFCNSEIQTRPRIQILNTKADLTDFWNAFVTSGAIVNVQVFYNALLQEVEVVATDIDNNIWTEV